MEVAGHSHQRIKAVHCDLDTRSRKKEIRVFRTAKRMNVQFVVEHEVDVRPSKADFVGIDLGVTNLSTFSKRQEDQWS